MPTISNLCKRLLSSCRRQLLVWKLRSLQGWRDELSHVSSLNIHPSFAQKLRDAQIRNQQDIGIVMARLAKLEN